MSKRRNEDRIKNWKSKAIERRKENDDLKSRNKELLLSRDNWKRKYQEEKSEHRVRLFNSKKAKGHHYSLMLVTFVLDLLTSDSQ
jgi:hypothetical protein